MDRDELAALDEDALIDLIVRLYDRVTESEARVGRPPKGPGNSLIPPSAGYKPNRAERRRKKRGPKQGHHGLSRRRATADVLVRCRPTDCRGCRAALVETGHAADHGPQARPKRLHAALIHCRPLTTPRRRHGYLRSYGRLSGVCRCGSR
jgi:hypothetical protein